MKRDFDDENNGTHDWMLYNWEDSGDDEETNMVNIEIVATIASSEMQLKQFLSRSDMKMALRNGNYFC